MVEAIIALVVLGFAGSIFWVLPSPAQRRKAKLRADALPLGFTVRFSEYCYTTLIEGDEYEDPLICYAKRPTSNKARDFGVMYLHCYERGRYEWKAQNLRGLTEKAQSYLQSRLDDILNMKIYGFAVSSTSYRFYWLEQVEEESLADICQKLDEIWNQVRSMV